MIGSLRAFGKLFIDTESLGKLSKIFPNIVTENAKISPGVKKRLAASAFALNDKLKRLCEFLYLNNLTKK